MNGRLRRLAVCLLISGLGLTIVSCGDEDDPPTSPQPPTATPVVTQRLEITAPADMPPGQSAQLSAHAVKNDGTREDVTSRVQWTTSVPGAVRVTESGMATAGGAGESIVTARLDSFTATTRVLVLPAGTYLLSGSTLEFGAPVAGVEIEVLEGVGAGMKTFSRPDGTYSLYGVSGFIRLHLKKDDYINATPSLVVNTHTARDLVLESATNREPYTGTYTLTITAVAPCTGSFPDVARRRVYTAHMLQKGVALTVRLSDADFILTRGFGNGFPGWNSRGVVNFDLRKGGWYYYYFPEYSLVERVTPTLAVVVEGYGEGSGPTTHLRGRLGTIHVTSGMTAPHSPLTARCTAEFEMIKQ